jgi:hypothetical protein
MRIGSSGVSAAPNPASVAAVDDEIKSRRAAGRQFEAAFPAEALRHRIAGRTCEHRHREQPGADDAEREQKKCKRTGQRPQRFGGLRGGADLRDAMRMQRSRRGNDDEKADDIRQHHARGGVDPMRKESLRQTVGKSGRAAAVCALLRSLRSSASSEACQKNM